MRAAVAEISSESFAKRSSRLSTKNAWAQYVRRRFNGLNLVKACQAEWNLTEGQARGLVYAQVSQATVDAVLDAVGPLRAFGLSIEIASIKTGVYLEAYVEHQIERARNEATAWEAEEHRLADIAARVSERRALAWRDAEQMGAPRSTAAGLGDCAEGNALGQSLARDRGNR